MNEAVLPSAEARFVACVDPELRDGYPRAIGQIQELFLRDLDAARALHRRARAELGPSGTAGTALEVPGLDADPAVPVRVFNDGATFDDCAIVWLHGGAFWAGSADQANARVFAHVAPVYSVGYRLAPENRAPAPARDVAAVLNWLRSRVQPRTIAIGGESAGAGIAACAALLERDRGIAPVALQLLLYPALDDRLDTSSARRPMPGWFGSRAALEKAWGLYLGDGPASAYAAAARAVDLRALPRTHLAVGELDLLHDECVAFAARLRAADVPVTLHVYPGAPHGFDHVVPSARVSRAARADCEAALLAAFSRPA